MEDLDSCVNCNAGLISVSDICPQCGWPKDKPIESERAESEDIQNVSDAETPQVKFVNRLPRPAGVRMLGMAYIVSGIIVAAVSIIIGSLLMYVMIAGAMSGLGAIGGVGLPMPLPMGGIDPALMASLTTFSENPVMGVFGTAISGFLLASTNMDVASLMMMLGTVGALTTFAVAGGLVHVIFGKYLLKGNKWARYLVIVFAIIYIPSFVPFVDEFEPSILVFAVISGSVLYYLFKPHVRAYFAQPPIKKEKKSKKSKK